MLKIEISSYFKFYIKKLNNKSIQRNIDIIIKTVTQVLTTNDFLQLN